MTTGELVSIASIAFGIGSGGVALYIRSTISSTIIQQLNGRYTGSGLCRGIHTALDQQLNRIEHQADQTQEKLDRGFNSINKQLIAAQISRNHISRGEVED